MTREILFRGKTKEGKWIEGSFVKKAFDGTYFQDWAIAKDGCLPQGVQFETVGQFTGLADKDGKRIFEGDFIQLNNESEYTNKEYWNPIYKIEYGKIRINLVHIGGGKSPDAAYFRLEWYTSDYTIVGNIHDNPELLEAKP